MSYLVFSGLRKSDLKERSVFCQFRIRFFPQNADGTIASVVFNTSNETPTFGTRVGEDAAFAAQFVGKTGPFTIGAGIDALSGATVTSEAAVKAVNNAIK